MRRMIGVLATAGVLAPGAAMAQASFEGVVSYRMTGQGMTLDVTHHVREDRVRQEMSGPMGDMAMIIDLRAQSMTMLMPAQSAYVTMDMSTLEQAAAPDASTEVEITPTGRKETIAGIECEHYALRTGDNEIDICGATGMGFYMAGGMRSMSGPDGGPRSALGVSDAVNARLRAYFKDGLFPLKMTMPIEGGGELTIVATGVEKKELPDELFVVPPGYTEMKLPRIGG